MQTELEYKFIIDSKSGIRSRLQKLGAIQKYPEQLMRMQLFDYPNKKEMNATGKYKWWRVRDEGQRIAVTLKEMYDDGKTRDNHVKELEIEVNDYDKAAQMLVHTGLIKTAEQEKYQEAWQLHDIEISIDTWPTLPPFIELEGEDEQNMKKLVTQLGLSMEDVILGSADYVFQKVYGVEPDVLGDYRELTFANEEMLKAEFVSKTS